MSSNDCSAVPSEERVPHWKRWSAVKAHNLNREQAMAKVIDSLITLLSIGKDEIDDSSVTDYGLSLIAEINKETENLPITLSIKQELEKRGLLES